MSGWRLVVEDMRGSRGSSGSLGSEIIKAFETIFFVRLSVFKLKFGLKLLISELHSLRSWSVGS